MKVHDGNQQAQQFGLKTWLNNELENVKHSYRPTDTWLHSSSQMWTKSNTLTMQNAVLLKLHLSIRNEVVAVSCCWNAFPQQGREAGQSWW